MAVRAPYPNPADPSDISPQLCGCGCGTPLRGRQTTWATPACRERGRAPRLGDRHRTRKPDTRTGNRHRPKHRQFLGVDGESVDDRYVLLAAASDEGWEDYVECPEGLHTADCLRFIARLPTAAICWGFSFSYDVNMILWKVRPDTVQRLYDNGKCRWRNFYVEYVPKKMLRVVEYAHSGKGAEKVASTVVWDMFPWQQTSFANWLRDNELADEAAIADIEAMKNKRATFAADERDEIIDYCLAECRLLAKGARRMVDTITVQGFRTGGKFYSPASLAKAEMKRQGVGAFMSDPPEHLLRHIEAARFGGRAEVGQSGPIEGPVWQHDIRSAYPTQLAGLPCLAHGGWRRDRTRTIARLEPTSLVRVSWKPRHRDQKWGPFPMRNRLGILWFPSSGQGWFWGEEVKAAERVAHVAVQEVWTFSPKCSHEPFAYIPDMYTKRQEMKAAGDSGEYVLKLALNSTYGALAERPHRHAEKPPPWRSLVWAGMITAGTRATMLSLVDDSVVMIATDGIFATSRLPVQEGERLGEWEVDRYDALWIAGTGFYFPFRDGDWLKPKTRGFAPYDMPRDELIGQWEAEGRTAKVTRVRRRFIGMGTALHRINGFPPPYPGLWRQWIDQPTTKTFNLYPRRQWLTNDPHDGRSKAPTLTLQRATDVSDHRDIVARERRVAKLADHVRIMSNFVTMKGGNNSRARADLDALARKLLIEEYSLQVAKHGVDGTDMFARGDQPFGESDA